MPCAHSQFLCCSGGALLLTSLLHAQGVPYSRRSWAFCCAQRCPTMLQSSAANSIQCVQVLKHATCMR